MTAKEEGTPSSFCLVACFWLKGRPFDQKQPGTRNAKPGTDQMSQ